MKKKGAVRGQRVAQGVIYRLLRGAHHHGSYKGRCWRLWRNATDVFREACVRGDVGLAGRVWGSGI